MPGSLSGAGETTGNQADIVPDLVELKTNDKYTDDITCDELKETFPMA